MIVRKKIESVLEKFIKKKLKIKEKIKIDFEIPKNKEFGDYSTRVFFNIAKEKKYNIQKFLENIKNELLKEYNKIFSNIKNIHGFTNLFLKDEFIIKTFKEYQKQNIENIGKNKRVIVEFFSANPTGRLHIGNARSGLLGDALSNLLEVCGYKVTREYYLQNAGESRQIYELGLSALGKSEQYKSKYLKKIINSNKDLTKKYKNDPKVLGEKIADIIFKDQKKIIEKKLKIKFDNYFEERTLYKTKFFLTAIDLLKSKNLLYKDKKGKVLLKKEKFGFKNDRTLLREDGSSTYLLIDFAYHIDKFEKRKFDIGINIWGFDHQRHKEDLLKVLSKFKDLDNKLKIILYNLIFVKKQGKAKKMSKRLGTLIDLEEFVDEIGIDVLRFFILKYDPKKEIVLDKNFIKQKSFNNPLYYLQYSGVRAKHILNKIKNKKFELKNINFSISEIEKNLVLKIIEFDSTLILSCKNLLVHPIVEELLKLCDVFNKFYETSNVVNEKNKDLKIFRTFVVKKFLEKLNLGCKILGIKIPEKM